MNLGSLFRFFISFRYYTVTTLETDSNDAAKMVENEAKSGNFNVAVGGGIEMRRGAGRLQEVYGPMAMISFGSSSTENTYGNQATSILRETATSSGSTIGLSLGGFAGIEYFFAPKMSLGAEVQWGINVSSTGAGETTSELFDGTNTITTTAETGSSSAFGIGTTPNSMISLNFHF